MLTGVQTPSDVFGQTAPYLAAALGWPSANVVVKVELVDGTARVQQEYAGGRLAVLGLPLPAVVGVQSASSPPRYVAMGRLRQAMTEATTETVNVSVEPPGAVPQLVSLAPPVAQAQATMLDGDADEVAAKIVDLLRSDVQMTLFPECVTWEGRDAVAAQHYKLMTQSDGQVRSVAIAANRQPAVAIYVRRPNDTMFRAWALVVLAVLGGKFREIATFASPEMFERFNLPLMLD